MQSQPIHLLLCIIDLQGGAGVFLRNLAMGLKQSFGDEFSITLLMCREGGRLAGDERWFDRVEVLSFDVRRQVGTIADLPRQLAGLRHALRALKPDVILSAGTYANLMMPLAAAGTAPCVLTVHSNTQLLGSSPSGRLLRPIVAWRYSGQVVVAPSQGVADDLADLGIPRPRVIPHGIDLERIRQLAAEPMPHPIARPYVVAVGRLTPAKDYPTLLRAFALGVERGLSLDLVIVGDGPDRAALQDLARQLNISQRVHFLGHRDNPFACMANAEFFVLSSVWEGFGLVLIEAMALGLPCLSTDCPSGPREILRDGTDGLLVPPGDPVALAEAMLRLAGSAELRATLSRKSRQRAEAFTLRRMAAAYRNLLLARIADAR